MSFYLEQKGFKIDVAEGRQTLSGSYENGIQKAKKNT